MNPLLHIITLFNLGFFVTATFLVLKKWNRSKAHRRFVFVLAFGFLWILDSYLQGFEKIDIHIITYFNFAIAACVAGAMASFALQFPDENRRLSIRKEALLLLPIFVVTFLSFTKFFVQPVSFKVVDKTPYYYIYFLVIAFYFIFISFYQLFKKYLHSAGIQRQQLKNFLLGYSIAILFQLSESFYVNTVNGIAITTDRIIFNITIFFIGFASYSILRYRFLDLRLSIKRGTIRIVSLLIVLTFYFVLLLVIAEPLFTNPKSVAPWAYVALGLLVLGTVEPLRKYVTIFIDKRFELHDRQQERIQIQLQIVLKSQRSLSDLEQAIRKAFQETASVDVVEYVDADDQKLLGKPALRAYLQSTGKIVICEELPYRLDEDPRLKQVNDEVKGGSATAYVPIGQNEIFVGCFVLGPRKGKVAYSAQEVATMKLLQSQATEAFLNARLYKQAVERIRV